MASFEAAIPTVLKHEGGYSNDPADAGGETKYGISKRSYPNLDIAALTIDDAKAIYLRDFWKPLLLDQLMEQSVATKVLDTAVLVGKRRAVKFLQHAAHCKEDGCMGAQTVAAVNASSPQLLLAAYRNQLATFYTDLAAASPTNLKFLKGWLARASE